MGIIIFFILLGILVSIVDCLRRIYESRVICSKAFFICQIFNKV